MVRPTFSFLLISIERLAGEVDGVLGRLHRSAVLFHVKLRVAHFDAHLIFQLVQTDLGLAVFQFRANLVGLRFAITQWNVQREAYALVGSRRVDELVQGTAVADRAAVGERRRSGGHC